MAVRESIFGSKSEERGFRSIERTWGERYRLIPQFPMSALFVPNPAWKKGDTSNLFFKTSFDYVLATDEGRPLLAIDFDGMGKGFDRDGEYVQIEATKDRYRKSKFDFKLRYAIDNGFPYHIVSSDEFNYLGDGVELTLVDGIIGSALSRQSFMERAPAFLEEHAEDIASQSAWYKSEYIQYLLTELEVDCDWENNPITRKSWEAFGRVRDTIGNFAWSERPFSEPDCTNFDWPPWSDFERFKARTDALNRVSAWGCVVTIPNTTVGEVSEVVTIRNVANAYSLAVEIARWMAWNKLLRILLRRDGI